MSANQMLAMVLAGGRGSRLEDLTNKIAKPAVFYGGKYRIIDFPLSNCANSGVNRIGVLTQYESVLLNSYVSNASRWGLDGIGSGIYVLSPREKSEGVDFYQGTADAIYQNIDFIEANQCPYTLILSGDHIYKMNYEKMLKEHIERNADLSIAVLNVSLEEASRFGIMNCDTDGNVIEFEEKPAQPKSTKASMGIYIFNTKTLIEELKQDHDNPDSSRDFGKDIIPSMLAKQKKLYAYDYLGYWKDVGTIDSLWEANMDLLSDHINFDLNDDYWKIYTEDSVSPPHYISEEGNVTNSIINQGSIIEGNVENCILFHDVHIKRGAHVKDSVLLPGVIVEENVSVHRAIVDEGQILKKPSYHCCEDGVILIAKEETNNA
ncbi:MAG: glucose-1-phosphate adenylyltransferase [Erysipelotrichaceae bacterium]